ncbi:hypothetical protein [Peptostreptococcus equinus]|uniref:Uncharacterized protein n=1 Tax=Peptostreptococcus equinus TaxID=3003601 RepID=A0ABY7JQP6_9FIRM|nr:hypothetical protein [Peptostreptococcus sp. CBA3647]WAW15425.1 hypothetical protein O0R46_02985 [Peptostreptococcus sp. CBA3647]
MKVAILILLVTNIYAASKWVYWSRGFIGAFCMYQEKYGKLSENELRRLMKEAVDYGIKQTINDLSGRN